MVFLLFVARFSLIFCLSILFFWINTVPLHNLQYFLFCSFVNGNLGWFHTLMIVNNDDIKMEVKVAFGRHISFP